MHPAVFAIGHTAQSTQEFLLFKKIVLAGESPNAALYQKKLIALSRHKHAGVNTQNLISSLSQTDYTPNTNPIVKYAQCSMVDGSETQIKPRWLSIYYERYSVAEKSSLARFLFAVTPGEALALNDYEVMCIVDAWLENNKTADGFPKYVLHYTQSRTYFSGVNLTSHASNKVKHGLSLPSKISLPLLTRTYARKFDIHPVLMPRFSLAVKKYYHQRAA
jgi:hypothetical protein